jgi:hypothetical protein
MSMFYDEELPAGFQDADIEQAEFEAESARIAALERQGHCQHGHRLGRKVPSFYSAADIAAMLKDEPLLSEAPFAGEQSDIPEGQDLCLGCGELVEAW